MQIFQFDRREKVIEYHGSQGLRATRIARGDGGVGLTCLALEPGGVIGTHPATGAQLFLVVSGEGGLSSSAPRATARPTGSPGPTPPP